MAPLLNEAQVRRLGEIIRGNCFPHVTSALNVESYEEAEGADEFVWGRHTVSCKVAGLAPLLRLTAAYFVVYYTFMCFQSFAKIYLVVVGGGAPKGGKKPSLAEVKYGQKRGLALTSDRTFLNMVEQAPAFLTSVWLYGAVVDVDEAAQLGWLYLAFRLLYPAVFPKGVPLLFISTFPNYFVVWGMLGRVALRTYTN